jgi:hypothetical protein
MGGHKKQEIKNKKNVSLIGYINGAYPAKNSIEWLKNEPTRLDSRTGRGGEDCQLDLSVGLSPEEGDSMLFNLLMECGCSLSPEW